MNLALVGDALSAPAALAVLVAGWLIGATGIGGVLVVPALVSLQGMAAAPAIAASALAFAFPGVAALWAARSTARGAADAPDSMQVVPMLAGAGAGALCGAWLVHRLQPEGLLLVLAALAIASGLRGLRPATADAAQRPPVRVGLAASVALGVAVGIGSGLTGTGGPVLLIPALLLLHQPLRPVITAAQLVQLPVALAATLGHAQSGLLDLPLAVALGLLLLAGSLAGQWAGRRLATRHLHLAVSALLLATGAWLAAQSLL